MDEKRPRRPHYYGKYLEQCMKTDRVSYRKLAAALSELLPGEKTVKHATFRDCIDGTIAPLVEDWSKLIAKVLPSAKYKKLEQLRTSFERGLRKSGFRYYSNWARSDKDPQG